MKLISRILPISKFQDTKDDVYVIAMTPTKIIDNSNSDSIIILGNPINYNINQQFNINKLYYTKNIKTLITECIVKNEPMQLECEQYKMFNNKMSKMYNTWKVIQIQNCTGEWIQLDNHSKIF